MLLSSFPLEQIYYTTLDSYICMIRQGKSFGVNKLELTTNDKILSKPDNMRRKMQTCFLQDLAVIAIYGLRRSLTDWRDGISAPPTNHTCNSQSRVVCNFYYSIFPYSLRLIRFRVPYLRINFHAFPKHESRYRYVATLPCIYHGWPDSPAHL